MNYPFWDVDIGYGWLMGGIAVFHVFISHFAIGGGLYLVVAETAARKANNLYRLEFLKRLSKFFVLTTVVMGAVTGVGIWFIIGLLNPAATEALIHHFVWGWATEWTFFIIEIAAALFYFYGWDRMSARSHLITGWLYFGAAWMSLFIINGIITFMLTPGDWLTTGYVWDGFFNPTFWSSLVLRTGICIMLAGIYALAVTSTMKTDKERNSLVRYNAIWGLVGLAIMVPSFFWYFADIPESIRTAAAEIMPTVMDRLAATEWYIYLLAALIVIFGLVLPRFYNIVVAVVVMALGLVWFGQYEWLRESIRKPYVITGYMYGNATEVALADSYTTDGYLPHIKIRTGDDGADLFRHLCRSCHTVDGYKSLDRIFAGTDEAFVAGMVKGIGVMKGNMPPFLGTEEEAGMIAAHLYPQFDRRPLSEITGLSGVELGRKVYDIRCGTCHVIGGFNDKSESLVGLEEADYNDLLDMAEDLGEEMPAFTASEEDRAALIEFLMTLEEGGTR